jgi:hypothetical protein
MGWARPGTDLAEPTPWSMTMSHQPLAISHSKDHHWRIQIV